MSLVPGHAYGLYKNIFPIALSSYFISKWTELLHARLRSASPAPSSKKPVQITPSTMRPREVNMFRMCRGPCMMSFAWHYRAAKSRKTEVLESVRRDYRMLPLVETKLMDYSQMKHHSLNTNELLSCRWKDFVKNIDLKNRSPFMFPRTSDFHFYNYQQHYAPSQSTDHRPHFRFQMRMGPGEDACGQLPIPDDVFPSPIKTSRRDTSANQHKTESAPNAPTENVSE